MRNSNIIAVNTVESTFKNIDSIIDNLSKSTHSTLSSGIGFSLAPYLSNNQRIELSVEQPVGLFIEYFRQLVTSKEGLFVAIVGFEHFEYFC